MDDPLRDALSAAYDKVETSDEGQASETARAEPEAQESPQETEAQAAERLRDEQGRFKAADDAAQADGKDKPRPTLTLKKGAKDAAKEPERKAEAPAAKEGNASATAPEVLPGSSEARPGLQVGGKDQTPILPPQHWNGREKIEWDRLPYHVKQTLAEEYKSVAELREIAPAVQHFAPQIVGRFGNIQQGLGTILNTWSQAVNNPLAFTKSFIQQFNIDPQSLAAAPGPQVQPNGQDGPQYVTREELAAIEQRAVAEAEQRLAARNIQTEVESFGATRNPDGTLAYPYFNDVKPVMAGLFQSGQAKTLKQAYDDAVYAIPHARQQILAAEQERLANERRRAADTARQAAVSVTGSPGHRGPGKAQNETADQTLSRVYEQLASGGRA